MHEKTLPKHSMAVLKALELTKSKELTGWILAGGTGLALHLGHRISEDFDFFRTDAIDVRRLHNVFSGFGKYETLQEEEHTLTILALKTKISFFRIKNPFIFETTPYRFFSIADIRDIALMKLVAISSRGSRKDFVDLFEILRGGMSLQECFAALSEKYIEGRHNSYHILKSMTYFEDAEKEPMPVMLKPFNWKECKAFFVREAHTVVLP